MLKQKILELRGIGRTYSEISKELNCSKSTISYYCGVNQKQKNLKRQRDRRSKHPEGSRPFLKVHFP